MSRLKNGRGLRCEDQLEQVLTDVGTMLDYALEEGLVVPEDTRKALAQLCKGAEPANDGQGGAPAKAAFDPTRLELALTVHGELSDLVEPATPATIEYNNADSVWIMRNNTVKWLMIAWGVSMVILVVAWLYPRMKEALGRWNDCPQSTMAKGVGAGTNGPVVVAIKPPDGEIRPKSNDKDPLSGRDIMQILGAAGLGAAFYGLYTAHKYILNRSFDPKYEEIYMIRLMLGVMSGTILGLFGKGLLLGDSTADGTEGDAASKFLRELGMPVLALVGGYASEAVAQVLQRFSDTLVTIVKGSSKEEVEARKKEAEVEAEKKAERKSKSARTKMVASKDKAAAGGATKDVLDDIQKAIDELSK